MNQQQQFTDQDITNFLKGFLEIGGTMKVDEGPDKYLRLAASNEVVTLPIDDVPKPLAIYGTKSTDAIIINPFAEGNTTSPQNTWFFSNRNRMISIILIGIVTKLLECGAAGKKKGKKEEESDSNLLAVEYLGKYAQRITDNTVKDFASISKDSLSFFNIFYNRKTKICEVKCLPFIPKQREAYRHVSTTSWEIFEGLILDVLHVKDLSEFSYSPTTLGIPQLESFCHVFLNIYEHMRPLFPLINVEECVELNALKSHLKYLPQYYAKAKWCTSMLPTSTTTTAGANQPLQVPQFPMYSNAMPPQMPMPVAPNLVPVTSAVPMPNGGFPPMPVGFQAPYVPQQMGYMPGYMPMLPPVPGMPMPTADTSIPQMGTGLAPLSANTPQTSYAARSGNPFCRA